MKNKPNIALIGCGRIGFLLENDPLRKKPCTHYGGAGSAGLKINYACDINRERLNRFGRLADIQKENLYTDYEKLIKENDLQIVIIATWTESHADIGILAAQNGAKIIVCEKPIAPDLIKAEKLLNECKKYGTALVINHERRYDSRYRAVKKIFENGKIGEIKTVHASILTAGYRGQSKLDEGGGPLLHDGTHMIDIIRFLFGEIESVTGEIQRSGRKSGFEDRATAWLKTQNGPDIFLEAGGNRNYFVFELVISGTEGKIVIGNGYEYFYSTSKSRFYTGFRDLKKKKFPKIDSINYFKREYTEAKNIIKNNGLGITSSGYDGYKALEAIHAIYLSSHLNKSVELPVKPEKINLKEIFDLK